MASPCPLCKEQFSQVELLKEHLRGQHKIINDQVIGSLTAHLGGNKAINENKGHHQLKKMCRSEGSILAINKQQFPLRIDDMIPYGGKVNSSNEINNTLLGQDNRAVTKNESPKVSLTSGDEDIVQTLDTFMDDKSPTELYQHLPSSSTITVVSDVDMSPENEDSYISTKTPEEDDTAPYITNDDLLPAPNDTKFSGEITDFILQNTSESLNKSLKEAPFPSYQNLRLPYGDIDKLPNINGTCLTKLEEIQLLVFENNSKIQIKDGCEINESPRSIEGISIKKEEEIKDNSFPKSNVGEERITDSSVTSSVYVKQENKVRINHWTGTDLVIFDPEDVSSGTTKCPICDEQFEQHQELTKHNFMLSKVNDSLLHESKALFKCPECQEEFQVFHLLTQHIRFLHDSVDIKTTPKHSQDVEKTCDICQRVCKNIIRLKEHKRLFHTIEHCMCELCGMKFELRGKLKTHTWKQHNPASKKTMLCHICNKSFSNIKRHNEDKHDNGSNSVMCSVCAKSLKNHRYLRDHMEKTHADPSKAMVCPQCPKVLKNESYFKKHLKYAHSDTNIVNCEDCGNPFSNKNFLRDHIRSVHDKENKVCKLCSKSVNGSSSLRRHIEDIHSQASDEAPCPTCPKTFRNKRRLQGHIYSTHTDPSQTVSCIYCPSVFKNANNFKQHIRIIHTVNNPVSCPECGKQFPQKSNLITHKKIVHGTDVSFCGHCGKRCKNSMALKAHTRNYHKE